MAEKEFILDLAKLVIAAAWADGDLSKEEMNALKDLLFVVPDMSGEDWHELELYIDSPVSPAERQRVMNRVVSSIRWTEEKQLVIDTLTRLVKADGEVTGAEAQVLEEVKKDVEGAPTGLLAHLTQAIRGAVGKRRKRADSGPNREESLEDFIKNRIYFHVAAELERQGHRLNLPDEQIRKLCLAAGLMAQVAWVDRELSSSEKHVMKHMLMEGWTLSDLEAGMVTEISCAQAIKGLDLVRLTRNFVARTTHAERKLFVRGLFKVANATQKTSFEEIKLIEFIAKSLKIPRQEFIEAKLTIPREDRGGL